MLITIFPQQRQLWVFSHSKGFGAELLSDSLWFSGADPSWAAKRFCGRFRQGFHQGSTKVPPCKVPGGLSGFLGQMRVEPNAVGDILWAYCCRVCLFVLIPSLHLLHQLMNFGAIESGCLYVSSGFVRPIQGRRQLRY